MKKLLLLFITSVALLGIGFGMTAADNAPAQTPAKTKKSGYIPFRGIVSSVDKTAQTVSLRGAEKDRVFVVTSETVISKSGGTATINDVAVGDYATGAYVEKGGKMELRALKLGQAQKKKEK